MSAPTHGPLAGVKVVACSTAQAGTVPYLPMADLSAEAIKIEVPNGGDTSRENSVLPGMPSTYFETNNRGVKSVTLNLTPVVQTDDSSAQHPHSVMTGLVPVISSGTNFLKSFAYLSGTIAFGEGRDKPGHDGEGWDRIGRRFGPWV
jgi:hypothetical protein